MACTDGAGRRPTETDRARPESGRDGLDTGGSVPGLRLVARYDEDPRQRLAAACRANGTDMLKRVRQPVQGVLGPLGAALARRGVNPNVVTFIGTVLSASAALVLYPRGDLFWGSFAITIFVLFDMVDGALARARGITGQWGAFLDSNLDRVSDAAVFAGLIWWFAGRGNQPVL